MSEVVDKVIEVEVPDGNQFFVGQQVNVEMLQSLGTWAVLLGYFFPFVLLLAALSILIWLGFEQGIAGLLSLGIVLLYYLALFLFKAFLRKKFTYHLSST